MKKTGIIAMLLCAMALTARAQEYVDLGLSVRWATCNIGADSPEDKGIFYTWVDAMGSTQDVVTQTYGEGWRMPTEAEWQELINGCNWSRIIVNGWECLRGEPKAQGYGSHSIYLPLNTGYIHDGYRNINSTVFWTATATGDNNAIVANPHYTGGTVFLNFNNWSKTSYSMPIRGVKIAIVQTPQAVDMGNGLYWADANIGAIENYDAGFYFAWGDTEGSRQGKLDFTWERYSYCDSAYNRLTKYNGSKTMGTVVDGLVGLQPNDDAADALIGDGWRMPTIAEVATLENGEYYTWEWYDSDNTEYTGHAGYKVTSKANGNSIFLPATGYCSYNHTEGRNSYGSYWTNCRNTTIPYQAETMCFDAVSQCAGYGMRCEGRVIRAVKTIQ